MEECAESQKAVHAESAFGREARLRNRWQLDLMRERGVKSAGRHCVLIVLQAPPDGMRRAAFLISRKYSLLAVDRNRARRLFREVYRRLFAVLPPVWLLFIPRQRMKNARMDDILGEVRELAGKVLTFRQETAAAGETAGQAADHGA